jgi:transposase
MLDFMARSTVKYLKKLGYSNAKIAEILKHDPRTVARALAEPVDKIPVARNRLSSIAIFETQIEQWLEQKIQVKRMLELACADPLHPYQGKPTAFYDFVRKVREARQSRARQVAIRFEGLPGEFLQIDWGEIRNLPFTKTDAQPQTFYFFCARLKYSRFMFVRFEKNMVEETLVRCLIDCFLTIGGVPWVVTTDNMKTVVLRRDEHNQPVWHPVWLKLAIEFEFHPEACAPASPNQKGAVENLVKYTQNNFLTGRTFYDELDLQEQLTAWLTSVNHERPCQATGQLPGVLLQQEKPHLGKLNPNAQDYGLFESLVVNREAVVTYQTNRYSVPASLLGQTLTARIHKEYLRIFDGDRLVAEHKRCFERNRRIVNPEHFEKAFETKPRARTMVYRDWLLGLSPVVYNYVSHLCHKQRATMNEQICALYALAHTLGQTEFVAAVELANEQAVFGAEYVRAIATSARPPASQKADQPISKLLKPQPPLKTKLSSSVVVGEYSPISLPAPSQVSEVKLGQFGPQQHEVERQLSFYEELVANRSELELLQVYRGEE